jgi:phosphocarrier protein
MNEWPSQDDDTAPHLASAAAEPPVDPGLAGCGSLGEGGGVVLRRAVTIRNSRGLHARAAAKLVALAERYSACLNVSKGGQSVPACSIMGLMMLGAGVGSEVAIEAEGWDAKEALEAVAGLVEAGFGED